MARRQDGFSGDIARETMRGLTVSSILIVFRLIRSTTLGSFRAPSKKHVHYI
jgi:hypothetical protein